MWRFPHLHQRQAGTLAVTATTCAHMQGSFRSFFMSHMSYLTGLLQLGVLVCTLSKPASACITPAAPRLHPPATPLHPRMHPACTAPAPHLHPACSLLQMSTSVSSYSATQMSSIWHRCCCWEVGMRSSSWRMPGSWMWAPLLGAPCQPPPSLPPAPGILLTCCLGTRCAPCRLPLKQC